MRKLLIISDCGANVPDLTKEFSVTALGADASPEERLMRISEAEVIIGEPTIEELSCAKNLRWLQMTWAGADRYLKGGFPQDVLLTTASGAFGDTIAEHALAMLFSLCRRLSAYGRSSDWLDLGSEKQLSDGRALVFGCGDIGSAIAKRLKALNVHTIGVCQDLKKSRPYFDVLTNLDCAPAFFDEADFILCALPHNEETAGYFGKERLSMLKEDAVIVNVGRGSFLDISALTELLQAGKYFGVGLDVVDPEPLPPEHPLWSMSNVVLTPHVAGVSFGHLPSTEEKIWEICRENLRRYLAGEPLRNQVILP